MSLLAKIDQPPSLKQMAYDSIKAAILVNRLEPGRFYNEQQLARELAVSKTPVREALLDLAAEGFVTSLPRRGFQIRVLTEKDIRDLYGFRRALESLAVRTVAEKVTEDDLGKMEEIHAKGQRAIRDMDGRGFLEVDREFHLFLVGLSQNGSLISATENARDLVEWSGFAVVSTRDPMEEISREHGKVIEALRARDGEKAGQWMEVHLRNSEERTVRSNARDGVGEDAAYPY